MTAEDEARAEAEKLWPDDEDHTVMAVRHVMRAGYVNGYLAASRREPSEAIGECDQCGEPFSEHTCVPIPSCIHVPGTPDTEDDEVESFRSEWLKAHDEGDMGNRVRRGLRAAAEVRAAASRREPSGASANVSNRPKDDISSGEMSVSEPSDTDEREWEYADLYDRKGYHVAMQRRTKATDTAPAGPWEVFPDGE